MSRSIERSIAIELEDGTVDRICPRLSKHRHDTGRRATILCAEVIRLNDEFADCIVWQNIACVSQAAHIASAIKVITHLPDGAIA
jgi:hypothetical protein